MHTVECIPWNASDLRFLKFFRDVWIPFYPLFSPATKDEVLLDPDSSTHRHHSMSSSSTNIRPPSEDLNGCSHERGEHQDCSNTVLVQSQRAFEKLVLGQVSALESTFNEAMKANHPNQAHNALTCKQIEETKSRTGIPFEGIDEKSDKNCSQQNEEKSLLGKRRPSSRGIGSSSDGGASSQRSRSFSSAPS